MNWKEFLKPNRAKLILFFFIVFLTLTLFGVMLVAGLKERIPLLVTLLMIAGWVMIGPFMLVTIAGLFLGNLLGGLEMLVMLIFYLLAMVAEILFLYSLSCALVYLKNKIKK